MLLNIIQHKREILTEEGKRKAQELRADFGETSARTGYNVKEVNSITYAQLLFDVEETYMLYQSIGPNYTLNINRM